jgi:phage terminase large subunit
MTDVNVTVDRGVFNEVYIPHLTNKARTQIYYGGSASGKSVFLAQRTVWDLLQGGRNYLICRAVGRTVKGSVWIEVQRVIRQWGLDHLFEYRIVDRVITCGNGYQAVFTGLDDVEKLKSIVPDRGVFTDIWIEEATEVDKRSVTLLYKRQRGGDEGVPKRLTMSFNPILQSHWIYKEYFENIGWAEDQTEHKSEDLTILKTTYRDNRFLTEEDREDLEDESDEYYYQVYTLGNWGVLGNVIFHNWEVRDLSGMGNQWTNRRSGLDFGYASDPAALVCTHYDRKKKTIYIYDELYETELTNDVLADLITDKVGSDLVVCDSSEPKSIAELQKYQVTASGAIKGKDSVLHGIQWLQQHRIIIDKSCVNTRNEFMQYKWKEDKSGAPVSPPRPVDANNHLIDALRYAYENDGRATWLL